MNKKLKTLGIAKIPIQLDSHGFPTNNVSLFLYMDEGDIEAYDLFVCSNMISNE